MATDNLKKSFVLANYLRATYFMSNYYDSPFPVKTNLAKEHINKTLFFTNIKASITLGIRSTNCNPYKVFARLSKNLHKFLRFITFRTKLR